jgi:hypothetical protein
MAPDSSVMALILPPGRGVLYAIGMKYADGGGLAAGGGLTAAQRAGRPG